MRWAIVSGSGEKYERRAKSAMIGASKRRSPQVGSLMCLPVIRNMTALMSLEPSARIDMRRPSPKALVPRTMFAP